MGNHAVALRVAPLLRIECKFWITDDPGMEAANNSLTPIRAGSFEHAKSEMETALGRYIECPLRSAQSSTGQAA